MKRFYECTFIINPGMDEAQIENLVKMTHDTITKNGGEVVTTDHIGRKRLAYPILKKHNGFYVMLEFESEGHVIEKVERFLKFDENVIRYLTLELDKRELAAKHERKAFTLSQRDQEPQRRPDSAPQPVKSEDASEEKVAEKEEQPVEVKEAEKTENEQSA